MIRIFSADNINLRISPSVQWYVHPDTEVTNDFFSQAADGDGLSRMDVINGPKDVPVMNVPYDKVHEMFKRSNQGRMDIKFSLYRKAGVLLELVMTVG